MKLKKRRQAELLRRQGKSFGEIIKKVRVSKSTLSLWLKDVKLNKQQIKQIYQTFRERHAYRLAKLNQEKKKENVILIIKQSIIEFNKLARNPLFLCGLMLYWAEGDKSEGVEAVKFSNSDPAMIQLMMRWFKTICLVPNRKFRIALHIHELHNQKFLENYWSKITQIPPEQFNKTQIKNSTLKFKKKPLYQGTCSIRINDRNLFRKIKGWKIGFLRKEKLKISTNLSLPL